MAKILGRAMIATIESPTVKNIFIIEYAASTESVSADCGRFITGAAGPSWVVYDSGTLHPDDDQTPFQREKAAFIRKRSSLRHLTGKFVAMHNGQDVASDETRNGVLRRFFSQYPAGTSVYIGFVGPRPIARVSAPRFVRRSKS